MAALPTYDDECFFIAPIGEDGSDIRRRSDGVLNYIVGEAVQRLGLSAVRADHISKPGQITLQVIEHVVNAKAVVADLTGHNPNVFYELAVRHAVRKPVVLICEKSPDHLPFDIGQMRTIFFDYTDLQSAAQCRDQIESQLSEAIHSGAVDSPIATAVDVTALASGNQLERSVAELVNVVNASREEFRHLASVNSDVINYLAHEQVTRPFPPSGDELFNLTRLYSAASGKSTGKDLRNFLDRVTAQVVAEQTGAVTPDPPKQHETPKDADSPDQG